MQTTILCDECCESASLQKRYQVTSPKVFQEEATKLTVRVIYEREKLIHHKRKKKYMKNNFYAVKQIYQ